MKMRRAVCLLVAMIMVMAMSTTTADAASFKSKPTGVKAKCVSGVSVTVSCKAKKGAKGYMFYCATSKSGSYKLFATTKKRTATKTGLKAGKTYYFKVKAYKLKKKKKKKIKTYSKMSSPVKCQTVLQAPNIQGTARCDCMIDLKVSGYVGSKGYRIYRSKSPNSGFVKVKSIKTTGTAEWTDTDLNGSVVGGTTTYYYKVSSYSGSYESPLSAALKVTTQPYLGNGNNSRYDPEGSKELVPAPGDGDNALTGRGIFFLGSSITYGSATDGISFADYIEARNGAIVKKEAVSGTTMATQPGRTDTYVYRLTDNWADSNFEPAIFASQLSLNDSFLRNDIPLGELPDLDFNKIADPEQKADYITELYNKANTVGGAIGYITAFAYAKWPDCQVVFFTVRDNGYNEYYGGMRKMLLDAQKKYGTYNLSYGAGDGYENRNRIEIIDMWAMKELTNLKGNQYCFYMNDANHPNKAGYLYQWVPAFEESLINWMPPVKPAVSEEPDQPDGQDGVTDGDNNQDGDGGQPDEGGNGDGSGNGSDGNTGFIQSLQRAA